MSAAPTTSIVIPTYNRRERLHRVLGGLVGQLDGRVEVIVVSDGSADGTDEYLASGDTPVDIVAATQPNQGPAAARNRGVDLASGELILFVDDDVVPQAGMVAAHREAHVRAGHDAVVIGPMLDPPDHRMSPWIRWEQAMLSKQYDAMVGGVWEPTARQFYTGNASVRREHLLAAGGFDTSFLRAEDVELAFRLADTGLRFVFEPLAVGWHYAERSFASWRSAGYQYGRNDVIFGRDRGRTFVLGQIGEYFVKRPRMLRRLIQVAVPCPRFAGATTVALRGVARVSAAVGIDPVTQRCLSAIYALAYYSGVRDELGDADELLRLLGTTRTASR